MESKIKYHMRLAELYGILAKKDEYIDKALHMHYYQKHSYHRKKVEQYYMK